DDDTDGRDVTDGITRAAGPGVRGAPPAPSDGGVPAPGDGRRGGGCSTGKLDPAGADGRLGRRESRRLADDCRGADLSGHAACTYGAQRGSSRYGRANARSDRDERGSGRGGGD